MNSLCVFYFYDRYASLFFCVAIEREDNELLTLEVIHRYVEILDKYFGNVSFFSVFCYPTCEITGSTCNTLFSTFNKIETLIKYTLLKSIIYIVTYSNKNGGSFPKLKLNMIVSTFYNILDLFLFLGMRVGHHF